MQGRKLIQGEVMRSSSFGLSLMSCLHMSRMGPSLQRTLVVLSELPPTAFRGPAHGYKISMLR